MRDRVRSMFSGAQTGRLTDGWPTTPQPADWVVDKYQRILVARMREQATNNDYVKAYMRLVRNHVIGPRGIMLQSRARKTRGKPDVDAQHAVESWWKRWGKHGICEVTGRHSWRSLQAACVETCARDGEFFLRKLYGANGGKYGFALQFIDPQRCPVDYNEAGLKNGNFIRQGIEFNRYGRAVAYYFQEEDTQSASLGYSYGGSGGYVRVVADEVIHGFVEEMAGQKRGFPWLASALFRLRQMNGFEEAAVVNARVGAAKMGFIEFEEGFGPQPDEDESLEIDAESGAFVVLPEGAKLSKFDPQFPSGDFAPFIKQCLRAVAAGGGVSYHNLAQDLEGVNFSSIRQGVLDEREFFMERQEFVIEQLCDKVFEAAFDRALLGGHVVTESGKKLTADKFELYAERDWQGRRWTWIDPRADVDAAVDAKNNMLRTPGSIIREGGGDPLETYREWAADMQAMRDAGIEEKYIEQAFGLKQLPPKPDAPKKEAAA